MAKAHLNFVAQASRRFKMVGAGVAFVFLTLALAPSAEVRAQVYTVLDTAGTATSRTAFSVSGSTGQLIGSAQLVGPQFTLTQRSVLTKIEALVNNCAVMIAGVPQCPNTLPFVVQIRRSINGAPDPRLLIAAVPLTHDNDPLTVSMESAALDEVPLEPGTYFALFAPQQESDAGFLLSNANGGAYQAGMTTIGIVTFSGSFADTGFVAVRIAAKVVPLHKHASRDHEDR
ncbi:hypothetical protein H6CHR_03485 [Variovorax sp. PBL-H6]|nr:hypothetical protein H6CHR_03485 [Variovorax sp. PBL-H6]